MDGSADDRVECVDVYILAGMLLSIGRLVLSYSAGCGGGAAGFCCYALVSRIVRIEQRGILIYETG